MYPPSPPRCSMRHALMVSIRLYFTTEKARLWVLTSTALNSDTWRSCASSHLNPLAFLATRNALHRAALHHVVLYCLPAGGILLVPWSRQPDGQRPHTALWLPHHQGNEVDRHAVDEEGGRRGEGVAVLRPVWAALCVSLCRCSAGSLGVSLLTWCAVAVCGQGCVSCVVCLHELGLGFMVLNPMALSLSFSWHARLAGLRSAGAFDNKVVNNIIVGSAATGCMRPRGV